VREILIEREFEIGNDQKLKMLREYVCERYIERNAERESVCLYVVVKDKMK